MSKGTDIHLSMRAVEWLTKSPYNYGYMFETDIAHRACDGKLHTIMNPINQHTLWCGVEDVRAMFNKQPHKEDFKTKAKHAVITPTCMDCIIKLEMALEATIMKPYKHYKEYLRKREIEVAGYAKGVLNITDFSKHKLYWRGPHSGTLFAAATLKRQPPPDDPDWVEVWVDRYNKPHPRTKRQEQEQHYLHKMEQFWLDREERPVRFNIEDYYD